MVIRLSDHFTYGKLLRFTLPSIGTVLFTSIYSVVDAFFVANFVGTTALAAMTLIFPLLGVLGATGFMLGTGGAAIVGKLLGQGRQREARRAFSLLVAVAAVSGTAFLLCGQVLLAPVARLCGAEGAMLENSVLYGRICLLSLPCFMLQFMFQSFFVAAERPVLGLAVTVAAGCANMVLDALFIIVFGWALAGAAIATAISEGIGGLAPLLYFLSPNASRLRLVRPATDTAIVIRSCGNGASEFLTNIAYSLLAVVYNAQLLRVAGETGVAAFGVLLYVSFVFSAIFMGYSIGVAPIVSFCHGANNAGELRNIFRKSLVCLPMCGAVLALAILLAARPLSAIFAGQDAELGGMTTRALRLYSPTFLLCGLNIFASAFFTALNNGGVSASISCLRTLLFGNATVLILPALLGLDGIWLSWVAAEALTLMVAGYFLHSRRKEYCYA